MNRTQNRESERKLMSNSGPTRESKPSIIVQTSSFSQHRECLPTCISISTHKQTKVNGDVVSVESNITPTLSDRKDTKDAAIVVSNVFDGILSKYGLSTPGYRNNINKPSLNRESNEVSSSVQDERSFCAQYGTCSKYIAKKSSDFCDNKVTFTNLHRPIPSYHLQADAYPVEIGDEKKFAEKTTYCRPVTNYFNQQFIYKTMQRNDRIQKLMKKLVLVRQREKQRESWNNYINDLKNKHGYYREPSRIITRYVPEDRKTDMIDDCYNTKFTWKQSNHCQNLLQDFYGNTYKPDIITDQDGPSRDLRSLYENDSLCFPTSSQACIMMRNRCRGNENYSLQAPRQLPPSRYYGPSVVVNRDYRQMSKYAREISKHRLIKNTSIQTDVNVLPLLVDASRPNSIEENDDKPKEETIKEQYIKVADNVDRLKKKIQSSQCEEQANPLANIETKLDILINSINEFIVEVKSKKATSDNKSAAISCKLSDKISKISNNSARNSINSANYKLCNKVKSDSFGHSKAEEVICNVVDSTSKTLLGLATHRLGRVESGTSKLNRILTEELNKSNKVKRDIENILNSKMDRTCAVQLTFDIPTRDRATEVTDSLSKTMLDSKVLIEEIDSSTGDNSRKIPCSADDKNMTIAVNTDPLGLLALLRISRETIRQLLSYMPHIDYCSYIPSLSPHRQLATVSHYICNICGAAFGRPSQLSDHIQEHNLGKSRDCCVCRHVLDMQRNKSGLFACQYCGQRFTRAYCCELHQQTCARRLGRRHDVSSSLMILR